MLKPPPRSANLHFAVRLRRTLQHAPHDVIAALIDVRAGFNLGFDLLSFALAERGGAFLEAAMTKDDRKLDDDAITDFGIVFTDETGKTVEFQWRPEWVTDAMRIAVGGVILEWALLDHIVTEFCERYWTHYHPGKPVFRPFDRRVKQLREFAEHVYRQEPEELRTFAWFLQRLTDAGGKRDDIAHGRPGRIKRNGRRYDGLLVPFPGRDDRYIQMTLADIERLQAQLVDLNREAVLITYPLYAAHIFASTGTPIRQVANRSLPATAHSRSPKLPRLKPPPATFRA